MKEIREFWEDCQHRILEEENLLEIKEESMGLRFLNIDCVFTIEKANPNFYENDIYVDKALESFDLGELPIPGKFSDLLYSLGIIGDGMQVARQMIPILALKSARIT